MSEFPIPKELVTEDNFDSVMDKLLVPKVIAVDTETTGLNVHNKVDYLQGICIAGSTDEGFYFPFRHKEMNLQPKHLLTVQHELLIPKALAWHNRKFDMHSVKTIGIDPLEFKGNQYCTMLLSHLVNEELYSHQLDALAKVYLDDKKYNKDEIHDYGNLFGWENIPATLMAKYGAKDAILTLQLLNILWVKIQEQQLKDVYLKTEMPFTSILYEMEQRGVGVNRDFVERKARIGRSRMSTLQRELGFNPASTKDLGRVLIEELGLPVFLHTPSCEHCKRKQPVGNHEGKPSFAKAAMKEYDEILEALNDDTAKRITEYRGWQKATTSLYEPLLEKVGPDGRIRTEFKQHGTVTGRLSASNPNLQQVPRNSINRWNGDAKTSFTSGQEGFTLIGWDYSQLELRLAAAYGNETLLLEEFKKPDADPFSVLAPLVFGYLDERTRQDTKTFVYANLYGAGLAKIAFQLGRGIDEVQGLYLRYKESIKGIMRVSQQVTRLVETRKFVKYHDGRRRHFRNKSDAYKAWNSVCQGGGAQLVKQAMIRCKEFEDENCQMVLQVHDEITFIIKTELIPHYEPLIIKAMTDFDLGVTLAVSGKEWK